VSPRLFIPVLLTALSAAPLRAQIPQPNDKAARVLKPLLKRPGSGPLFERFVNAWLDTGTLDELGRFLAQRAADDPATANRLLLALFHSRQGEPVKALEQFRVALASDPGSADIWYQKALLESRTLDFAAAIASLGKCLALKPAGELPLQAAQLLGRLQARAGRTEEALLTWDALMQSRPADEELREDILELQIAENLWPAAQETAQALVEKTADPYRRVLRRMRLGDVLDRAGQREKALETFAACLADTGAGSWLEKEILSQIEKLFRREDDLSGLRAYFNKLIETHAHRAGLQRAQARLLMEEGEIEAAVACGRALMALSPGDRAVREEFIALLTGAGRAPEAIPQVELLLTQAPDDLELRLTLADLKHAAKDTPGALAVLRDYEQRAAGKEGTALRIAGLMERYGAPEEAVKTLRTALEKADQPETRQMLASLLHKSGKKDEALTEWKRLAAGAGLPQVQQTARAMQAHGETAAAWDIMQSAAAQAENDPVFLTQLCALADEPARALAALPAARRLVELARSPSELNNALDVAQRTVRLSGKADGFMAELAQSAASAPALCLLATLREAGRDTIGANAALEKARAVSPELALSQLVRLWTMRGDFAQAAVAAETLFNSPGGRQGHVAEMLASLHQRAGHAEAALRWTQEWRKLVPGAVTPVLAEARLLETLDRESEALAALRSAAGRFEGHEDIRARLAALSLDTGRTAEALRIFSTLYEEAADLSAKMRWLGQWGEAAQQAGQLDSLIARFEDRRRENRGSAAPLMALAELHRIADNYDARRNALTEAARLKPDDPEIALEIARLESRENDTDAAIRTLRPMLPKDSSGRVAALLADLLINSGQLDEGIRLLTERTAASPGAVELAALALARRDEEATALHFLRPHLEKYPDDVRLHFLAALIEWRTNDSEASVARLLPLVNAARDPVRAGTPPAAAGAGLTYEEMVVRLMPPDVQRFFRLLLAGAALNTPNSNPFAGYGRQSPYTGLPASLEELQDRSAALIMEMAKSAAPDKQAAWTEELERRGLTFARLMGDLPPLRRLQPADRTFDFAPLLREYPDSRPLLALAALATGYRQWTLPADEVMAEQAWSVFKADAPPAALFLALPGAGRKEPPAAWESELLAAAEKLENAPALLAIAALRSGSLFRGNDDSGPLPADGTAWQQHMVRLLEEWYAADDGMARGYAASLRAQVLRGLARHYARSKAAAPLAALLDAEWRVQAARPQMAAAASDDELAAPLGFPPWFLPGLPETLRDILQRGLSAEEAALAAPLVQEPVLRMLLAARAGGDAGAGALPEAPPATATSAVPFILAASWAEKRGDFSAAAEQAVKALYLPVSQEARRRLDGALAYWASKKGKPGDALHAAGREALLRLRRDAVTEERRAELATLMDRLGLTEEADRLMRQGKAVAAGGATPDERQERLLDDGKNKEALPQLVSEIRAWARLRLQAGGASVSEELTAWRTRVQANGLLPQVLAALLPPQATPQQMAEYAAVCDLTGDLAAARDYYERALAGGVRKQVPLLLLSLVVREDRARALALLAEFPDLWKKEASLRWMTQFTPDSERQLTLEEMISVADFFEQALEKLPAAGAADFPADTVLEGLSDDAMAGPLCRVSEIADGNHVSTGERTPAEELARAKALAAQRRAVCERLARRLMALPGCGLTAFAALEQWAAAQKKAPGELLSEGCDMIVRELTAAPGGRRADGNDANVLLANTVVRLMRTAAQAGRTAEFAEKVVTAVRAARSPAAAEKLLENWPLYEPPAEQFAAAARAFLQKQGAKGWPAVIEAAVLRKTGADLAPDLLAHYIAPDAKGSDHGHFQFGQWCVLLEELQGRVAAETFFHTAMQALLGPAAERAAFFKDALSSRLVAAQRLMGNLAFQEQWTGFALRFVRAEFLPYAPAELKHSVMDQHFSEQTIARTLGRLLGEEDQDHARAKAFLDSLPLTEEAAAFFGGSGEMLVNAGNALGWVPREKFAALGLAGDRGSLTFGRLVLRGVAQGWPHSVWEELAGWEDRLAALPEPQGSLVLGLLRGLDINVSADTPPGARAFYHWLHRDRLAAEREDLERDVAKFLKDAAERRFESDEALVRRAGQILRVMEPLAHPRGREVLFAAHRALAENAGDRGESALMAMLLEMARNYRDGWPAGNPAWLTALLVAAIKAGESAAEAYDNDFRGLGRMLLASEDTSVEGRLAACLERLAPVLQAGEAGLIVQSVTSELPGFYGYRDLERRFGAGLAWVESLRGHCSHEELRLEMEMALRFHRAAWQERKERRVTDEAALPVEQRHYLALLRDPSLALPLRVAIGTALLGNGGNSLEPPLVLEVARLLQAALADGQPVRPSQEAGVFTALANLPAEVRDAALVKSLLPLTTLPRLRGDANDYEVIYGLVALLDLALHAGDTATADRLLEMEGRFPGQGAVSVLARHGQQPRLAALLKERPEVLQREDDVYFANTWDAALQRQLPAVLEAIADPVQRFEARVLLTLFRDPEPLPPDLKPRAVRAAELAAAFSGVPWKGLAVRDRVLSRFFTWDEAAPEALLPVISESAARVPLAAVPFMDDDQDRVWTGFSAVRCSRALLAGDAAPLLEALHSLRKLPRMERGVTAGIARYLLQYQHAAVLRRWPELSPEQQARLCADWLRVAATFQDTPWRDEWKEQLQFTLVLHALAGRMEDLQAWLAALPDVERVLVQNRMENQVPDDLLDTYRYQLDEMPGPPEAQRARRLALFTALAVNPLGISPGLEFDGDYLSMESATPEEFITLETPLCAAYPDDGWLAAAFARVHAARGAWEQTLYRCNAVLVKMKPERGTAYAPLLELRVQALENMNRGDEALPELLALAELPPAGSEGATAGVSRAAEVRLRRRITDRPPASQ